MASRCLSRRKSSPSIPIVGYWLHFFLLQSPCPRLFVPACWSSERRRAQAPGAGCTDRRVGTCPARVSRAASVDVGQDSVRHAPAVLTPGQAVLPQALLLVPGLAVHQQCREVEDVEVGQQVGHSCGEVEAVTAQQPPSSQRFSHQMAHRDTGSFGRSAARCWLSSLAWRPAPATH